MTTTEMLERYLQAVGQYLPEAMRSDTIAELRANLLEQMDARAEELGRPLNTGDVAAMLKEHGKPESVALRYLPKRSLIGPAIFPFYVYTLKRVVPLALVLFAIAKGTILVARGESAGASIASLLGGLMLCVFCVSITVTIVFAAFEYARGRGMLNDMWTEWNPEELPAVRGAAGSPQSRSMAKRWLDIVLYALKMAYWILLPWHPVWAFTPHGQWPGSWTRLGIGMSDATHMLYIYMLVLFSVGMVVKLLGLSPANDNWRRLVEFGIYILGTAGLAWWVSTKSYFVALSVNTDMHTLGMVNDYVGTAMRIIVALAVFGIVMKLATWGRGRRSRRRLAF